MTYELAIIGGGPAGVSAGVYAARKRIKTLLVTETFGGQSSDSMGIENWIGTKNISGPEFAKVLEDHIRSYQGESLEIKSGEWVEKIEKPASTRDGEPTRGGDGEGFKITSNMGTYSARAVLITTGSNRRKLDVPGAAEFENKGITYCASCDGPLFSGQDVAVIGGGNAGFETAAQLLAYCKSVTLLNRGETFKADELTVEKVLAHPNMKAIKNAQPKEIKGSKFVESMIYTDLSNNTDHELPVTGIFVEIGLIPTTGLVKDLIPLNEYGQIPVDPRNQRTSLEGLWAAGDSTDGLYHQNNIASGDAVKALEDIYMFLRTGK